MASSSTLALRSAQHRLRQGVRALLAPRGPVDFPRRLRALVPVPVVERWMQLPAYDQHHLVNVAADLEQHGHSETLVLAGLLHDIGKPARASVVARVVTVVVQRFGDRVEAVIQRLGATIPPVPSVQQMLNHPESGATFLARHHLPDRIVWLVRYHHCSHADPGLRALRQADERG